MSRFHLLTLLTKSFCAVSNVKAPGWFGARSSFQKLVAPAAILLAGMTFSCPLDENTHRPTPVAVLPVVGSKTMFSRNCVCVPSVVQTVTGLPALSNSGAPSTSLKLPSRQLVGGIRLKYDWVLRCDVRS